jgi:hypothetical protein
MLRGMGIQSVRKEVIAEDLEKKGELNPGAQIEEKVDNVMEPMDERRRTEPFLDILSVSWKEVRIELQVFGGPEIRATLKYI